MKALEQSVPARYFAQLIDFLEARGMPCCDALSAAQIRSLNDPQARLTPSQVDALLLEVTRLTGRTDLGFELGRLMKLNSHDVLGYAMISCPTIDHVLRLVSRYYRLMTPMFVFRYQRSGDFAELLFQPVMAMPELTMRFHIEMVALSFHVQIMALTENRQTPYDMYLSIPTPPHAQRYRELGPARAHFDDEQMTGVRIKINTELFDQALPMMDLRALSQAEARCKQLMQEFSTRHQWRDWIEMMLREVEDSQPTLDELARILNISERALERHLSAENVSFRELAVTIRNERACRMLAEEQPSVSQIAYRLGYTDIANFSRSFKRVNGLSPSAYIEQCKVSADL